MNRDSTTSLSLLARLKEAPGASPTWDEFVARYQPRIVQWCRRWGLQESDALDVSQNVMLELSQQMRNFEYQPGGRFRAWLKTVARRAWYDYSHRRKRKEFQADESEIWHRLDEQDAEQDLLKSLEEECEREFMSVAMQRVRRRVKAETWDAFHLVEFEGVSNEEAAERTGLSKASVYVARGRVQKMLIKEVEALDQDLESE